MKITSPVLFGDILKSDARVVDLKPTKNSDRFLFSYKNQADNQQVIEYQATMLMVKRTR